MQNKCVLHNIEQYNVLQDDKLVLYCKECAKHNILSIIQLEDQIEYESQLMDAEEIKKTRDTLLRQVILGMIIALYIQITPWIFASFFMEVYSINTYLVAVGNSYKWMWTQGWLIMLSVILIILGLYNVKAGISKLKKLPKVTGNTTATKKDILVAVKRFQSSFRLTNANDYLKKLHKRYKEDKLTLTPVVAMTEYEMSLYYAKLIQHVGFKNVRLKVPVESYGISMIAVKDGVRTAIMVVKDHSRLKIEVLSRFGVGRAYFDCEEAIILTQGELPDSIKKMANELVIDYRDMKKVEEKLLTNSVDEWSLFLEDFLIKNDSDLEKYADYEKQRLIHFNE